jgi:hypothetical protein
MALSAQAKKGCHQIKYRKTTAEGTGSTHLHLPLFDLSLAFAASACCNRRQVITSPERRSAAHWLLLGGSQRRGLQLHCCCIIRLLELITSALQVTTCASLVIECSR